MRGGLLLASLTPSLGPAWVWAKRPRSERVFGVGSSSSFGRRRAHDLPRCAGSPRRGGRNRVSCPAHMVDRRCRACGAFGESGSRRPETAFKSGLNWCGCRLSRGRRFPADIHWMGPRMHTFTSRAKGSERVPAASEGEPKTRPAAELYPESASSATLARLLGTTCYRGGSRVS